MPNVFAVHATLPDEVRPTEAVFADDTAALTWADGLSTEPGVLAANVVRFAVDQPGARRNVAMFVGGKRQKVPHLSDCRSIHGGGRNRTVPQR